MTAAELARDDTFRKNWPYCSERLKKYLTQRQLDFSAANKGEYDKIGRYVEFQQNLFESLSDLDGLMQSKPPSPPAAPKLNNIHFQNQSPRKPIATPNHAQEIPRP